MSTQPQLRFLLAMLVLLAWASPASAFSPVYRSYKRLSSDGRFAVVMLLHDSFEDERELWKNNPKTAKKLHALHAKYDVSGVYTNDGSTTPLWTIDWYSPGVLIASDGIHLVDIGVPGSNSLGTDVIALSFYARGKLLRSYRFRELEDNREDFAWVREQYDPYGFKDIDIDDSKLQLRATTKEGNKFVFDLRTGAMERLRPETLPLWRLCGAGVAFLLYGWFVIRCIRPRSTSSAEPALDEMPVLTEPSASEMRPNR